MSGRSSLAYGPPRAGRAFGHDCMTTGLALAVTRCCGGGTLGGRGALVGRLLGTFGGAGRGRGGGPLGAPRSPEDDAPEEPLACCRPAAS